MTFREVRLWWLSPAVVAMFIGTTAIVLTAMVGDEQFRTYWDTPKLVTDHTLVLFQCGVLAFAFGSLVVIASTPRTDRLPTRWPNLDDFTRDRLRRASTVLTSLTMVGYAGFMVLIAKSGLSIGELFGGSDRPWDAPVKAQLGNIPGVTALTQVGIAAVTVSSILLAHKFSRAELIKLLAVLGLSIPRVIIYSERLAFLELAVPAMVIGAAWLSNRGGVRRTVAKVVPVVGLVLVAVMFSVFEYFRSWMFYRMRGESSFLEFVLNRLAGYYATAINNGQVILDHLHWPGRLPFDTLDNFWSVQGIYQMRLYEVLGGHDRPYGKGGDEDSPYFSALQQFANPEFNNPSGYVAPFIDYGEFGGLVFFLLLGAVAGLLYRQFARGTLIGLLVYPVFFTGLVEWPRYLYWFQGRVTFAWAGLFVVILVITLTRRRAAIGKVHTCTGA